MQTIVEITENDLLSQMKICLKAPELIDNILIEKVISEEVEKNKIHASKEEIQKMADSFRESKKLVTVSDTIKWMHNHCISIEELEKIAYTNVVSGKLAQCLFEEKVEQYYHENYIEYSKAVIHEIIFDNEDLAVEYFYAIKQEEIDFYKVARRFASDKALRRSGGYKGSFSRKELGVEISPMVFSSKNDTLLKPIRTAKGVHLIFVDEIIQTVLDKDLEIQIIFELYTEWLMNKIKRFDVKIVDFHHTS
jgi:parvulin-like peptidyl-prolyl isomerase